MGEKKEENEAAWAIFYSVVTVAEASSVCTNGARGKNNGTSVKGLLPLCSKCGENLQKSYGGYILLDVLTVDLLPAHKYFCLLDFSQIAYLRET